ncbi:MAG: hypothetical protein E7360_07010 [Clostridiales bacterium]|nr:hypothetical protein [Clostridiales bacterium]
MRVKIDLVNDFPTQEVLDGEYDLLINGFNCCEKVKYSKELKGETARLKHLASLSQKHEKTIVSAFDTDNFGIIRHSAGVFDNGKLLGISDMTVSYEDSGYMPGGGGKLYDVKCGKIAVAVGDDIYSFGLFKSFAVCGAEITVAICNQKKKEINSILIRAYSYLLGVPTVLIFDGGAYLSNVNGDLTVATKDTDIIEIEPYTEFILKTSKLRLKK